jgi:hypothetical protein
MASGSTAIHDPERSVTQAPYTPLFQIESILHLKFNWGTSREEFSTSVETTEPISMHNKGHEGNFGS